MSRKFLVLSALALGLIVPASAKVYTRDEAVKTAMENSADIKTAEEDLLKAASQVESGYGNAYPSIDLNATVTRIFGLDDVTMGTPLTDAAKASDSEANKFDKNVLAPALDGIANGMKSQAYRWQSSVGLTLTQVLYAAGKVGTAIEIAKAYKHLEEVSLDNAKAKVRYDVNNAFDQLILLDSSIVFREESIKQLEENLNIVTQLYQSGMGKEVDMIRMQLELEKQKSNLEKAKKDRILARNNLLNTMGLDWEEDVEFRGELRLPEASLPYPDTAMANVKKRRRELVMLEATEQMREKNIEIEESGFKPTIALVGGIKYTNNKNEFYKWDAPKWGNLNKYIALNLSMNLFNGMQTKEAVVQAKSDLRNTQIQKENAERGFRMQIESCANDLEDAQVQIENAKNQVDLAKRVYDITEAAYRIGKETLITLLDDNMKLRTAKLDYTQAILNWNKAYNALLQATGEY
jgi:OMF family outer membrane factor